MKSVKPLTESYMVMGDLDKTVPSDIIVTFCGWELKHGHHLGVDVAGDTIFSCNGYYEVPDPVEATDVGDRYARP